MEIVMLLRLVCVFYFLNIRLILDLFWIIIRKFNWIYVKCVYLLGGGVFIVGLSNRYIYVFYWKINYFIFLLI